MGGTPSYYVYPLKSTKTTCTINQSHTQMFVWLYENLVKGADLRLPLQFICSFDKKGGIIERWWVLQLTAILHRQSGRWRVYNSSCPSNYCVCPDCPRTFVQARGTPTFIFTISCGLYTWGTCSTQPTTSGAVITSTTLTSPLRAPLPSSPSIHFSSIIIDFFQEYVPKHSGVAPKLSWEMEQQLGYATKSDIARWPHQTSRPPLIISTSY